MPDGSNENAIFGAPPPRAGDIESVSRALQMLQVIASCNDGGIRFSDLCKAAHLSNATAHRLLQTMIHEGFVEQCAATRVYNLGFRFLTLGAAASNRFNMRDLARLSLQRLAKDTGDTVFLCVPSYYDSVVVDRVEGSYPIKALAATVGTRRPLGVGSGALALLAFMPDEKCREIIQRNADRRDLHPELDATQLRVAVEETRAKGYAYLEGTILKGMSSASCVIRGTKGEPLASISVAATSDRLSPHRRGMIVEEMRREIRRIENARGRMSELSAH
jgi:DNA-binding IclR family transcriptional regulator